MATFPPVTHTSTISALCSFRRQVVAWKKGHKHKCGAPGQGAAAATKLRRAVTAAVHAEATRAPGGLNADQNTLRTRLGELQEAKDWLGVVGLEQEALALARELRGTNLRLAGKIHSALGNAFHATGDYMRSRQEHEQHMATCEVLGDREGVAAACCNLGLCYYSTGDYGRARELHEQHKTMAEALGDSAGVAGASGNLGNCYQCMGDYGRARELHEQRMAMAEAMGDTAGMAKACANLGNCYLSTGDYARARELHEQHRAICEELGDRARVAAACGNIGVCYGSTGDYGQARELHERHRAISEALGDRAGVAAACGNLGNCYLSTADYGGAISHFTLQYNMAKELQVEADQATAALGVGVALRLEVRANVRRCAAGASGLPGPPPSASVCCDDGVRNAEMWLQTALDLGRSAACLHLACLAFDVNKQASAVEYLQDYLSGCVESGRNHCAGCSQRRGEDAQMLTCGGCRAARFCSVEHQRMASKSVALGGSLLAGRHRDVCGLLSKWRKQVVKGGESPGVLRAELLAFLRK